MKTTKRDLVWVRTLAGMMTQVPVAQAAAFKASVGAARAAQAAPASAPAPVAVPAAPASVNGWLRTSSSGINPSRFQMRH